MPGIDGIELLKNIKQDDPDADVIMITGHGDMDLAIKSLKYEAVDFITKPINIDALEISLKRVNEKILMRQKLKEYTEHLEELVREKIVLQDHLSSLGLMLVSISHDIKGVLTNMDGGIYLLNSGLTKKDNEKILEGFEAVRTISTRIKKIVMDVLFYAKERELKTEHVNTMKFLNDVTDMIEPKIRDREIRLIRDFKGAPQEIIMDEDSMRSALINILDNAADACLEDDSKTSHEIHFSVKSINSSTVFEISDNGTGMDKATKERLFQLFFSSKGNKGTGFGLFISNHIVKQHKGTISVKSKKGEGSQFIIEIPG